MNESFLEFLKHSLLIVGAGVYGEHSGGFEKKFYHLKFTNPITCNTTQVFMSDQEFLKGRRVVLSYRVRDNFTGEVTHHGGYGPDEIAYRMPD